MMKHQQILDLPLLSYSYYKYMCVDCLSKYIGPPNRVSSVEYWIKIEDVVQVV